MQRNGKPVNHAAQTEKEESINVLRNDTFGRILAVACGTEAS